MLHDLEKEFAYGESIELSDENPEVTLALSEMAKELIKVLGSRYVNPIRSNINDLRRLLKIKVFGKEAGTGGEIVIAVDSTWSKPALELVAGVFGVIISGYVVVGPSGISSYGITDVSLRLGNIENRLNVVIELDSKIMELSTALKAIEKHRYADIIMLDGSLFFSTRPTFFTPANLLSISEAKSTSDPDKLASIASSALIKLLRRCEALGVPVVGVVKRVSSTFIATYIGSADPQLHSKLRHINDKVLLSYVLRPGEYVVLDSYLNVFEEHLSKAMDRSPSAKKRLKGILKTLDKCNTNSSNDLLQELCKYMDSTAVVYYMPKSDMVFRQIARLDVYPRSAVEKVLEYVMENTSQNAVPIPIDYVDRFIRLESSAMRRLYKLALIYSGEAKEDVSVALGLTNPQKSYLYE
jgi:hypothetical protein